jgi:hypothetical protein
MVDVLREWFGGKVECVGVVAHSTQMLRLGLTFQRAARQAGLVQGMHCWLPTNYRADPKRLLDQIEILGEYIRLVDLGQLGILECPTDLPDGLETEAREWHELLIATAKSAGITNPSTAGLASA